MKKVKVAVEFNYRAECIVETDDDFIETFEERSKETEVELKKELDFNFGAEGILSNYVATVEEVDE